MAGIQARSAFAGYCHSTTRATPCAMPLGTSLPSLLPDSQGSVSTLDTASEIQDFLDNANAGDIGEISAGTYNAPANNRFQCLGNDGASDNPITLRAAAGATVILRPTVASPHETLVFSEGASFWKVENLILEEAGSGSNYQNLYVADNVAGCTDLEFWNCTFREANAGTGVFVEEGCTRIYLINCVSHDNQIVAAQNQAHGYYVTGDDCMMLNCIAYNQDGMGFQIRTNDADGPDSVIVANCVAYNCKGVAEPGNEYAGFYCEGAADNCQFHNNISYDNRNGFRGVGAGTPSPHNIASFNLANGNDNTQYNRAGASVALDYDKDGDGVYTSAGDNLTDDPLLTDPANFDFTLQEGSPAIGYGLEAYCPTFDHNNDTRGQCDSGAFAFEPVVEGGPGVWFVT